ncbi:MAG: UDP-glucuronate 4-epimerase [Flavobacteriales bacterium]|jgi:UDP-glucuronate 4-epimerase
MNILITGAAGFIGFHLIQKLIARGDSVIGIDNLNDYYDVSLKTDRLKVLAEFNTFAFIPMDLADRRAIEGLFEQHSFDRVIHLGAQAGVRYSIENPHAYVDSNILGFMNILECCRHAKTAHLCYASSSSVYGANKAQPFSEQHNVDHPVSLYAASKKSNELMAHTYSHLFDLPTTGLRFFTVYGPWGRPDMAYFKFVKKILNGDTIDVYNHGDMSRDFTYIYDIVEGVIRISDRVPQGDTNWNAESPDPSSSYAPYRIFNIGNNAPVSLLEFIETIEGALGIEAKKNFMPMQPGDVASTYADVSALINATDFQPKTTLKEGIGQFVQWYKSYYHV